MPNFVFILLVVSELVGGGGGGNSAFPWVEVCVCGGNFSFFMVFLKLKFRIGQLHTFFPFFPVSS